MNHIVGLILALTGLSLFIVVAIYVLSKIRESRGQNDAPSTQEMLNRFGELYDSGELTKEEFRAIKRTFAVALTAEIEKKKAQSDDDSNETPEERARRQQLERLLRN